MRFSHVTSNEAARAANIEVIKHKKAAEIKKGRRKYENKKKIDLAKRSGTEVEVAARMICRICNGGQA